jgi:hypothetical protein
MIAFATVRVNLLPLAPEPLPVFAHSLSMLQRIATALHRPLVMSFGPPQKEMQTA